MCERLTYSIHWLASNLENHTPDFWVTLCLALATVALAIYTARLASETAKIRRDGQEMKEIALRASEASGRSAAAAEAIVANSRDSFEIQERAWVLVKDVQVKIVDEQQPIKVEIGCDVCNLGKTPANAVEISSTYSKVPMLRTDDEITNLLEGNLDKYVTSRIGILGSGQNFLTTITGFESSKRMESPHQDELAILVYHGFLGYTDIFGKSHKTRFAFTIHWSGGCRPLAGRSRID
jgi:hypothetical protein